MEGRNDEGQTLEGRNEVVASSAAVSDAVTVVVTRIVKQGCEKPYERWLAHLIASASLLPGYLGANIMRPASTGQREYTSVFRFDSVANLRAFEESDLRRRALEEVHDLVEADAVWQKLTGLELWFTPCLLYTSRCV